MIDNITGVILAGGKSSRMGQNKALLPFQEKTLIETVAEKLKRIFSRVILSVNSPDAFSDLHLAIVVDHYPETGPMGAIASVLESGEKRVFCVACDMPFLNESLIEFICSAVVDDAVIPMWRDRPEVFHALYSDSLLPLFQQSLSTGRYKLTDALDKSRVRYLSESEIKKLDPQGGSFRNINTPAEYDALIKD
jgi:molybdopterin-guanine dinucleotide biosynthesis protein A